MVDRLGRGRSWRGCELALLVRVELQRSCIFPKSCLLKEWMSVCWAVQRESVADAVP